MSRRNDDLKESLKMDFYGDNNIHEGKLPFAKMTLLDHEDFAERIKRTLYYGKLPENDRPSLPMTDAAVNFLKRSAPKELGKIDMYWASDVSRGACISPCSLMLGMIYIERLKHKNSEYLNTVSSSDLFLISMMVASKYLYDEGIDEEVYNDEWAEAAAMDTADVNILERDFLVAIDWSLFTTKEDFEKLLKEMEETIALSQGLDRGGLWSYSDIMVLLSNAALNGTLRQVMAELCKVILVCSVAYTAGTLTVLGSISTVRLLQARMQLHTEQLHPWLHLHSSLDSNQQISEAADSNYTLEAVSESVAYENDLSNLTDSTNTYHDFTHGEREVRNTKGLSFPGLLTLTLIKNTVLFATGLTDGEFYDNNENDSNGKSKEQTSTCHCCSCPKKLMSRRQKWLQKSNNSFTSESMNRVTATYFSLYRSLKKSSVRKSSSCFRKVNVMKEEEKFCENYASELSEGDSSYDEVVSKPRAMKHEADVASFGASSTKQVENMMDGKCGQDSIQDFRVPSVKCRIKDIELLGGHKLENSIFGLHDRFGTSIPIAIVG